MQSVAVVLQRRAGDELGDVDVLADIHDVLALGCWIGGAVGRVGSEAQRWAHREPRRMRAGEGSQGAEVAARRSARRGHLVP